ncbi:MAG: bifunctional folylpolyglutamate synthase/dihydrofolate synthase [Armatimonadetes bacterium]|nr:bifunctional folylpolyglutamate synthase/dihydrofolate synthase [Armatimonadota bacterium]
MRLSYEQAVAYLDSLIDFEKLGATYFGRDRFQLATVRRLLAALGDPQAALKIVHIAGTKGKGSTAAILDSVLRQAGVRVGLFTKPHLVDIRERTRVAGELVSPEEFAASVERVRPHVERLNAEPDADPVTFYEAHLAATLVLFATREVEVAIIETGLGGRLDATNALTPVATAITRIDFDHVDILGDRLEDIAREKAGILKPGVPCVFAPQAPEVASILREQAACVGAPTISCPAITEHPDGSFDVTAGHVYRGLRLPLAGRHQHENAALAIALGEMLGSTGVVVPEQSVRDGLAEVRWPGRFQVLAGEPTIVLDVAHNRVSAQVLREGLAELLTARPAGAGLVLVVGIARDKDVPGFVQALAPLARKVVCTDAHSPRAADPRTIAEAIEDCAAEVICVGTVAEALAQAQQAAEPTDVICITGSFHVVGEAMQALGIEP